MTTGWLVFLIATGAVALFVLGLSLTLMLKGHHIDSEIGTNRHMRRRGIRCTAGEFAREEAETFGASPSGDTSCGECSCTTCASLDQKPERGGRPAEGCARFPADKAAR